MGYSTLALSQRQKPPDQQPTTHNFVNRSSDGTEVDSFSFSFSVYSRAWTRYEKGGWIRSKNDTYTVPCVVKNKKPTRLRLAHSYFEGSSPFCSERPFEIFLKKYSRKAPQRYSGCIISGLRRRPVAENCLFYCIRRIFLSFRQRLSMSSIGRAPILPPNFSNSMNRLFLLCSCSPLQITVEGLPVVK
jgi:hypothetical protein